MVRRAALLCPVVYLTNDRLGFIIVRPTNWTVRLAKRSMRPVKAVGCGPVNRSIWTLEDQVWTSGGLLWTLKAPFWTLDGSARTW
jgi:hypothetical protein